MPFDDQTNTAVADRRVAQPLRDAGRGHATRASSRSATALPSMPPATPASPISSASAASTPMPTTIAATASPGRRTRRRACSASPDGGAKVIADVARRERPDRRGASRPAAHRLRPFDGRIVALNFVLRHSAICMPRRSGTPISPPASWAASRKAILAWERLRLGSDVPSRILPKLTFAGLGKEGAEPSHPVRLAVARPARGRQICRRSALRLGRIGVDVAGPLPLRLRRRRRRQFCSGVRRDLPFNLAGGEKDPATDGGKSVDDARRGACGGWVFRISFQRFIRKPATKA